MCVKCKDRVFFDRVNKQFYYTDEGCNKVVITGAELAGIMEQDTTYPDVQHDDPLYNATDALKCAKATAMVNEMWNVIGVYQSFDAIGGFLDIVSTLIEAFSIYATGGIAGALAVEISDSFRNTGLDIWQAELEAIYLNEDVKTELICDLVDRMTISTFAAGVGKKTTLYDKDIDIALERFAALVPDSEMAQDLIGAFPKSSWKEVVTPKIPSTACGCEDYVPAPPPVDPTLPPEDGCIKVYPAVRALAPWDGLNLSAPLDYWTEFELYGTIENGVMTTAPAGNNGAGSDLFRVGAVFEISEGAEIIEVRWDWSSPYTQGTDGRTYQFSVYSFANEGANSVLSGDVTVSGGTGASVVVPVSGTWVPRSHITIGAFATASGGHLNQIKIRNIQFRIKSAADGFDGWVSAGQELCD